MPAYVNVALINGFKRELTYKIPDSWNTDDLLGSLVHVPLQKRVELALVTDIFFKTPTASYTIRELLDRNTLPQDTSYTEFIKRLGNYYLLPPRVLYKRLKHFLDKKTKTEDHSHQEKTITQQKTTTLTDEQKLVVDYVTQPEHFDTYSPVLLHGVTGSGKTEVYCKIFEHALAQKKNSLLLLPEVTLAVQFAQLLKRKLPNIPIYSFHSATSVTEKSELWNALQQQKPVVIIGVHLPILLPIANLGVIVVDEEHETGFQEKRHPKINTKEAAILRAQTNNIPIILGSATPSIQSLCMAKKNNWFYAQLTKRYSGAFATMERVSLAEKEKRSNFWITKKLEIALRDRLQKGEQSIIFLNRRGYSFFIQCSDCGFIFECPSCSVSLTLHADKTLRCHYCGCQQKEPEHCASCSCKNTLIKKGVGTQQLVTILRKIFPNARIERADLDSTTNKKRWQATLEKMHAQEIDILVGTQTITKGYHFPHVTLVGIIWADINLAHPFYNAAEKTLQQTLQVAGRAGRQSRDSLVIIQTMAEHRLFSFSHENLYQQFYDYECDFRKKLLYPPFVRLAEIALKNDDESLLKKESFLCATRIKEFAARRGHDTKVLGPAQPPVHKIKNTYTRTIYIKSSSQLFLQQAFQELAKLPLSSYIFFTPNPQQ